MMLHILLQEADDMTFLRQAKEVLEEKLNNEWTELSQWAVLFLIVTTYIVRICLVCCRNGRNQEFLEETPLQALQGLNDPSAPRLYPRFGN